MFHILCDTKYKHGTDSKRSAEMTICIVWSAKLTCIFTQTLRKNYHLLRVVFNLNISMH